MNLKMTKILTVSTMILLTLSIYVSPVLAQSPQKMSYQAVIRNASDELVTDHAVGIKISILRNFSTITSVYVETQTKTTNANGLLTLEIGGGTIVSGSFATIDWSAGAYYIKTEIDPTGGTAYTISGISQLLSVPYALHAKTAEGTTGGYTETDPIFVAWDKSTDISITASQVSDFQTSVTNNTAVLANTAKNSYPSADSAKLAGIAAGAEVNVNADWNAASGDAHILNKPAAADGSETKVTAGTRISVTGTGTTGNPYVINSTAGFTHYVGELYGGGIVVAVWKVGIVEHGLIASLVDLSTGAAYSNVSATYIGVTAESGFDGQANTTAIITQVGHTASAAKWCDDYTSGGFSDWYLPAAWEINQCYNAAFIVNAILGSTDGFRFSEYWSSTESTESADGSTAYVEYFGYGYLTDHPKSDALRVRAVRKF